MLSSCKEIGDYAFLNCTYFDKKNPAFVKKHSRNTTTYLHQKLKNLCPGSIPEVKKIFID